MFDRSVGVGAHSEAACHELNVQKRATGNIGGSVPNMAGRSITEVKAGVQGFVGAGASEHPLFTAGNEVPSDFLVPGSKPNELLLHCAPVGCTEVGVMQMARQVVVRLLTKIFAGNSNVAAHADLAHDSSCDETACCELDVRWMVTGGIACSVPTTPTTPVAEVKAGVQQRVGVPVNEQRLFKDCEELSSDVAVSGFRTNEVMLVRSVSDPCVSDLSYFHCSAEFEKLPAADFTRVRKLATGIHGDVFMYRWRRDQCNELVAMKRLRNDRLKRPQGTSTDERSVHMEPWQNVPDAEDALTEIGVLSYLSKQPDLPVFLLRMLGVFADDQVACLITEFADGGELFQVVASKALPEMQVRRYMWQLLQAVAYLHQHHVGHRDISLENTLLMGGVVKVMDFGMAVKSHSSSGTPLRFFRAVGKNFYRAPECNVPSKTVVAAPCPVGVSPGDVAMVNVGNGYLCEVRFPSSALPGKACMADVWGYAAHPADIWSMGVCLFIMGTQSLPWHEAKLANTSFAYAHSLGDKGLEALLRQWQMPVPSSKVMQLLTAMMRSNPITRPSTAACLADPWFAGMNYASVLIHAKQ